MTTVNLQELNDVVHNMYSDVGVNEKSGGNVSQWLIDNLGDTGRYGYRDYERFGNRIAQEGDDDHFDRQDGWTSLTEEVPNIQHLTYGTGILYIHGEMEIPDYENSPLDHIFGDEFYHVDKTGGTKHIYDQVIYPKRFISWDMTTPSRNLEYKLHVQPLALRRGDQGKVAGFVWEFYDDEIDENGYDIYLSNPGTIGDGRWLYETITDAVGGEFLEEMTAAEPETNEEDPPVHNDHEIYNLDNERNHFPWLVINSGRTESIKSFLEGWEGDKGMYDDEFPKLAKPSWPPKKHDGIKFVKKGIDGILDFMSPIEETP